MNDASLHRFSAFADLTSRERAAMLDLIGQASSFDAAKNIRAEGDEVVGLFFLHKGWVLSSVAHPNGSSQVLKVHRSGDILGAPSLPFETAVESLVALTATKVSAIPLRKLSMLFVSNPRLAALLYLTSQEERLTLMDRLAIGGQLGAKHNLATLLLLLFDGRPPSEKAGATLQIPLTQTQVADVLGLSSVHLARMMNALEDEGLIKRGPRMSHTYELPDVPRLRSLVGKVQRMRRRNPAWLPPPMA